MKSKRRPGRKTAGRQKPAADRAVIVPGWLWPTALAGAGIALTGAAAWFARQKVADAKRHDPARRPPYASSSTRTHAA